EPDNLEFKARLANCLTNWGVFRTRAVPADAESAYQRALDIERGLLETRPHDPNRRAAYALVMEEFGVLRHLQQRFDEAEEKLRDALSHRKALAEVSSRAVHRDYFARCQCHLGKLLMDKGNTPEAEITFAGAVATYALLTKDYGDVRQHHADMAYACN